MVLVLNHHATNDPLIALFVSCNNAASQSLHEKNHEDLLKSV